MSHPTVAHLLAVGLLLSSVTAIAAHSPTQPITPSNSNSPHIAPDDNRTIKCSMYNSTPLWKNLTLHLYAGDVERTFDNESHRQSWIAENCGISGSLAGGAYSPFKIDLAMEEPPGQLTGLLNKYQYHNVTIDQGYYPYGNGHGEIRIDQGQARIFAIENGTKVHYGETNVSTYIPTSGTLYGFYHFNTTQRTYEEPPYREILFPREYPTVYNISGGYDLDGDLTFLTVDHEESCVVVNGGNCSTGTVVSTGLTNESHTSPSDQECVTQSCDKSGKHAFTYDLSGVDTVNQITYVVEVTQQFKETAYVCVFGGCYHPDGSINHENWYRGQTRVFQRNTTLRHTIEVEVARPQADVVVAEFPDGHREAVVQPNDDVRRVTFGPAGNQTSPDSVDFQWEYFSASTDYWAYLDHQPVWIHAFPARAFESGPPFAGPDIVTSATQASGDNPPESFPANVVLDEAASTYTSVDEVVISDIEPYDRDEIAVHGILPTAESDLNMTVKSVQETNLSITRVDANKTHAEFLIELVGPDGDPIDTSTRPGIVRVNGAEYETDSNGEFTVVTRRIGPVVAVYDPVSWYKIGVDETAYAGSRAKAYTGVGRGPFAFLVYIIWRTAPIWIAVLILAYMLDQLPGAETWPPWRVIQ